MLFSKVRSSWGRGLEFCTRKAREKRSYIDSVNAINIENNPVMLGQGLRPLEHPALEALLSV